MKKQKVYILSVIMILFVTACAPVRPAPTSDIESFFPSMGDVLYIFEVEGFEEAGIRTIFNSYIRDGRVQRMIHASHLPPSTEVIAVSADEVRLVFGDPSHYTLEDVLDVEATLDIVILSAPLEVGNYWANGGEHWEITSLDALVSTPAGDFEALQVTVTTATGGTEYYYYVRDIGLVRSVHPHPSGEGTLVVSLLQRVEGSLNNVPIHVFFPNPYTAGIDAETRHLLIPTNADPVEFLNQEIHSPPNTGAMALLPEGAYIETVSVYREQALAHVELSLNLGVGHTIGDGTIANMFLGLVNTIGHMYDVAYVSFGVDGQPLEWGPIQLSPGEAIEVDSLSSLMELAGAAG